MKKIIALLCALAMSMSLWGCSGLLGGIQERNIGTYMPVLTDGEKTYLEHAAYWNQGYFTAEDQGFAMSDRAWPDDTLQEKPSDTRVVASMFRTGIYEGGAALEEEFSWLTASLEELLAQEEYMEYILLCRDGEFYGILNCYNRPAGRSGSLLCFEDLKYSCLLRVENGQLVLGEKMKDVALLACNRTHYIACGNKRIYSVCKQTGEKTQILEDLWWDKGPTYYCYVDFYFTDDVLYFSGRQDHGQEVYTLYACYLDGSQVQLLAEKREE